jgi:hypothetical protein
VKSAVLCKTRSVVEEEDEEYTDEDGESNRDDESEEALESISEAQEEDILQEGAIILASVAADEEPPSTFIRRSSTDLQMGRDLKSAQLPLTDFFQKAPPAVGSVPVGVGSSSYSPVTLQSSSVVTPTTPKRFKGGDAYVPLSLPFFTLYSC